MRYPVIPALVLCLIISQAQAETYRVGPGEKYAKISEVAERLVPGDVVEVTGDITDTVTLATSGSQGKPIALRGVTTVRDGRIIRPRVVGRAVKPSGAVIECGGDWIVVEGLDLRVGGEGLVDQSTCVRIAGDNALVRNCRMSLSWYGLVTDEKKAGHVTVEFCEFDSLYRPVGLSHAAATDNWADTAVVQHCYIHDCTGGYTMVRSEYPRTILRYNWFENASNKAVSLVGQALPATPAAREQGQPFPSHADIVGNVFFHGVSPDGTHAIITIGGEDERCLGPEGDFCIAHNLFVRTANGWDDQKSSHILMLPRVDKVALYNNVFCDFVDDASSVYNAEWMSDMLGGPRGSASADEVGVNGYAVVSGSSNWASEGAGGVPQRLEGTIRGLNPGMVNFLEHDYRPEAESPLAGAGLATLPEGRVGSLVPEYEPQRGIPADLNPRARRKEERPAIGPFEVPDPPVTVVGADEAAELVLRATESGARYPWDLEFGQARQKALEYLAKGEKEKALSCAKMQFILTPPDRRATEAAIESVKQMLVARDGNDARAKAFEAYARHGRDGADGKAGTQDDLSNPIAEVPVTLLQKDGAYYRNIDGAIDARATFSTESEAKAGFYQTEKAFMLINGAAFDIAAAVLIETLERLVTLDGREQKAYQGHAGFGRVQHQLGAIRLGLGAYYRAKAGTAKGMDDFVDMCINYCEYGPMGRDGEFGSHDDLTSPNAALGERQEVKVYNSGESNRVDRVAYDGDERRREARDRALADMKASMPEVPAFAAVEVRAKAITDSVALASGKIAAIAEAAAQDGNPFLYAAPSPKQLLRQVRRILNSSASSCESLGTDDARTAREYLGRLQTTGDETVIEAYRTTCDCAVDGRGRAEAWLYFAAYAAGAHDRESYPSMLATMARRLPTEMTPSVLIESLLLNLGSATAAWEAFDAVDAGRGWAEEERRQLLMLIAGEAKSGKEYGISERAYHALAETGGPIGARAQAALIALYAEDTRDFAKAVSACDTYLLLFPEDADAERIEYLRGLYKFQNGAYDEALSDVRAFIERHSASGATPNAMMLRGLCLAIMDRQEEALSSFDELAAKYPRHTLAARALFEKGRVLLSRQHVAGARDAFQRVVDFHPEDPSAAKAKEYLRLTTKTTAVER